MLEAKNLTVWRGDALLLDAFELLLQEGDVVQLQGDNGSGKTTLLRILAGLSEADEGEVLWNSKPLRSIRSEFDRSLLYLGHKPGISQGLSPVENLKLVCRLDGSDTERISSILDELGLGGRLDIMASALSAGQKRRVGLARLKLQSHRLWILDEPLTALKPGFVCKLFSNSSSRVFFMSEIDQPPGMLSLFMAILRRDLTLSARRMGQWLNPLIFFVIVVSLFPLGIGPSPQTLSQIAPGVLWVSALLATLLSIDALFARDYEDGTLEQMLLSAQPMSIIVLAKVWAHWLVSGLPLLLLSPLLATLMQLPTQAFWVLMLSLLLGTLTLSLIGAIGAALVVSLNQSGVLLSLLVLPLTVPVLIFGSSAVAAAVGGYPVTGQLSLLAALLALALSLGPLAAAAALREGVAAG